ncbi:MAG: aminotransferase class I/II-fold pyridoxal phosphate-dependent enzyme [Chloroflexota bacterium]
MIKRAIRLQRMPPFPFASWARHVEAARESGLDVIRLDMGNPDLPPPDEVIETLSQSAHREDRHGYPGYRGKPALREAIAEYYRERFGVGLDPESQVVPLIGSKEGLINLSLALLDPGDLILVPDPGYAPYTLGATMAGAEVYSFPLLLEQGFLPDLESIPSEIADRAVLMFLNYPNNPTGATADLQFFEQAVVFAREHNLLLCHDAPYCDVTFDNYIAPSMLQVSGAADVVVEFNSWSKTWNMAGWRMGMAVGNAAALAALAQVKSNIDSGIFWPIQEAAVQAFATESEWIAERNRIYQQRLDILLEGLSAAGLVANRPRATFYTWTKVPPPSEQFALALLKDTGVALAPGTFFGPGGEGYVRIALTAPADRIHEAMIRLQNWTA